MISYLRLKAPNDRNGNPQRIFLVYRDADLIATVDEEYKSDAEVRKRWPGAKSMGDLESSVKQYKELLKFHNQE